MIEVNDLSKVYQLSSKQQKEYDTKDKTNIAVDQLSFACKPGRVFSLLGPNGAGKTTTLRMLATILKPSSGSARIAGYDVVKEANKVRSKIGFLTGSTNLYDRLTASEIVKYFADLYNVPQKDFIHQRDLLFQMLGVNEFKNKQIGKLSTGMKQKVSICRTMIHNPEVVIFDEPTSGLDVVSAENIITLIKDTKAAGKTVIFSSHIMSEVELLSDDLAIISKGKLIYQDTFENFKNNRTTENITSEFIYKIKQSL